MDTTTIAPTRPRIVVGIDGSPRAIDALRHAVRFAAAIDARLDLVSAWTYPPIAAYPLDANLFEEAARSNLSEAVTAVFGADRPDDLVLRVMRGPAARALIDVSVGAEMLVVGSRGHGGFTGLLLGSVSSECAEHAKCSVLVVHEVPASGPLRSLSERELAAAATL